MIDWTKPEQHITEFFTVKDALYLNHWQRLTNEVEDKITLQEKENLLEIFKVMDKIRKLVNAPILVHSAYRPFKYNTFIGGRPQSMHLSGRAVDFHAQGRTCDRVRKMLEPLLEPWGIRCEDMPGAPWIHIDNRKLTPGHSRFFKP